MDKNNIILIKGGEYSKIRQALSQWLSLYCDNLDDDFFFELYAIGNEEYIIKAPNSLDNENFNYLVNYLYYPNDIQYKVNIEGFTTAKNNRLFPKEYLNKKLLLYIPETDKEGDNVYAVTSDNENIKIDFGGKVKIADTLMYYKYPDFEFERMENPEILKINKKKIHTDSEFSSIGIAKKRFKIISIIFLALFLLSFLLFQQTIEFLFITSFLSIMVMFWFSQDHKMLQIEEYYFYSIFISLTILIYGLLIQTRLFKSDARDLLDLTTKIPLIFLVLQYPLRYWFKKIIKREPQPGSTKKTFEDGIYIVILIAATFFLAYLTSSLKIK